MTKRRIELVELTDQENITYNLNGEGLQVKEIAEQMGVAYETVKSYMKSIKVKLGLQKDKEVTAHFWRTMMDVSIKEATEKMKNESQEIIEKILEVLDIKAPTFAANIGVAYQRIYDIQRGKTKRISTELGNKIISIYPQFNLSWLLTGGGEMLVKDVSNNSNATLVENPNYVMIPIVSQYAYAGYLSGFGDAEYIETLPSMPFFIDHEVNGKYIGFEVKGDSMDDGSANSLIDGDMLICRQIKQELWQYKLHIKKWFFVIVHKTEGILVKQITDHDTETGNITIHSLNNFYEDRVLNLSDVAQLFNVIQVSRTMRL